MAAGTSSTITASEGDYRQYKGIKSIYPPHSYPPSIYLSPVGATG